MRTIITAIKNHPIAAVLSVMVLATLTVCLFLLWHEKIDAAEFGIIFSAVTAALSVVGFVLDKYYDKKQSEKPDL